MINENVVKTIYHYCSLDTFMSIIKYDTIRLSNITKSNDSQEVKYIIPFINKAAIRIVKEYNTYLTQDYRLPEDSIEITLENLFNEFSVVFFVACFSEEKDLLSQWRGYANNASGVSIGFNFQDFRGLQDEESSGYKASQVIYAKDYIVSDIENLARKYIEVNWKTDDDLANVSTLENALNKLLATMSYYSVFYKNPAFEEEKEWRLVYNPFGSIKRVNTYNLYYDRMYETLNTINRKGGFVQCPLSFRIEQNTIKSYIDLNFSTLKSTIIKEIVIGPKANINDTDLRLFLLSNGYNPQYIKITNSTASYR